MPKVSDPLIPMAGGRINAFVTAECISFRVRAITYHLLVF